MIRIVRVSFLLLLAACVSDCTLRAASYLPMSDADLVASAGIAVRAEVVGVETRLDRDGDTERPFTVATLQSVEVFKGSLERTFKVVVPGGRVGDLTWWVPGAPAFETGAHVLMMLHPLPNRVGEYGLTEFGLSKFDLVTDATGRSFLVRPVFSPREDLLVSRNEYPLVPQSLDATTYAARDAEFFFSSLRQAVGGAPLEPLTYVLPAGEFRPVGTMLKQKWANLGGVELGNCGGQPCMARWYFDTNPANVFITGTQTNLSNHYPACGVDQVCLVGAAANNWHNVANTDIRISQPMQTGNFEIKLDLDTAPDNGSAWSTPYSCNQQGVVGIGGPQFGGTAKIYKGLSPYYACTTGVVRMRRWTCDYPSDVFVDVLSHEMGHALGLNHPDQLQSVFSTTTAAQWDAALMRSVAHTPATLVPQADDIQAMQFYYGTAPLGAPAVANFTFANAQTLGATAFTDTSTGGPTGWLWFFGEPSSPTNFSRERNPTHTYASSGTYTVDLIAGNFNGGSRASKQVTATGGGGGGTCTVNDTTLCLSSGRFKVTTTFQKLNDIQRQAHAVTLTGNTGYFWFFDNTNVEVVTKVLPFCSNPFNSIWVFAAGLTNVKVDITYLDTKTGTTVVKSNAQGTAFAAVQDTAAFKTCP